MKSETHNPENTWAQNSPKEELNPGKNENAEPNTSEGIPLEEVKIPSHVFPGSEYIPPNLTIPEPIFQDDRVQQLKEQLLIVQADFDNFRKRSTRDQDDLRRFACAAIIEELLPILDHFEMGLKSTQMDKSMLSGFQMIFSQLQTLLMNKGVKEIAPAGTPFDPLQQEAIAYIHHGEVLPEYVVETVRKGYLLNDRLLRPASVVVSKGKPLEEV
ncbi:MAG: nucleotide exchange factor GrpE [Puniceicoccales bacterium]|jgi:molecular chaperone GrpE|nr:nucleotide exchange factor GrpE [Puniceicoccales bacterium]